MSGPPPPIVLARFVCASCDSELMIIEKPGDQEPGPVTIRVPRSMVVTCRVCTQRFLEERRLAEWPNGSNSVN